MVYRSSPLAGGGRFALDASYEFLVDAKSHGGDMTMTCGGYIRLPGGSVVVALSLPRPPHGDRLGPYDCGCRVRVLVHAANRQRALTRLRNHGLRAVFLRGNSEPPTPDEITAVLHHPYGLVWREAPC